MLFLCADSSCTVCSGEQTRKRRDGRMSRSNSDAANKRQRQVPKLAQHRHVAFGNLFEADVCLPLTFDRPCSLNEQ